MSEETPIDWTTRNTPLGPAPSPIAYPPAYGAAPIRPRKSYTGLIIGLSVTIVVALSTIGAVLLLGTRTPATFTAHGTLVVNTSTCAAGGFSDIRTGTQAVVTDEAGKMLSTGQLESTPDARCAYTFDLPDVPAGRRFYGITISHRGTCSVHRAADAGGAGVDVRRLIRFCDLVQLAGATPAVRGALWAGLSMPAGPHRHAGHPFGWI